jgi:acetyltransferase-like isoleucine patch superfamily enzyme
MKQPTSDALLDQLRALDLKLRKQMNRKWQRDLPFNELLMDRWTRAKHLKFGRNANIYQNSYVYGDVSVGPHTWIGPFTLLDGSGKLIIGSYCSISAGVQIYTHDSVQWALSAGKKKPDYASVKIGDSCFIGSQTVIAKGVTIGHHSVIGAGSFVNQNIPPYSIAFGSPCRLRGRVAISARNHIRLIFKK